VPKRRHVREQLRLDVLARDEQLDRLDAGGRRSLDEIFALGGEEPRLLPVLARREELADEAELRVLAGGDQVSSARAGIRSRGSRPREDP
jgi:hypothetical protein